MEEILNPEVKNNVALHNKKISGELLEQKLEYLKKKEPEFYQLYMGAGIADSFVKMCELMRITLTENQRFVFFLDYDYMLDRASGYRFGNLTPDYRILLTQGLRSMRYGKEKKGEKFCEDYNKIIEGLCRLVNRIIEKLGGEEEEKTEWFQRILEDPAEHFDEAIQRILFVNQMLWQTDHYLVGLGAVDAILYPYYQEDIASGYMSEEKARECLKDFLKTLHQYYWYKSSMLMGDTGQILVLGGTDEDGNYRHNKLTVMLIEIVRELQLPDPKILLRVNRKTPVELLTLALETIATGVGSPLISNDEVIIPALTAFGIPRKDALQYTVSACWEPLIGGRSVSLNNMTTINFMRSLENLFRREQLSRITDFESLVETYLVYLGRNLNAVKRVVRNAQFQYDPVLSMFIEGCRERKKDVSQGGAYYFHAGVTSVALGNVVDSLLNMKELVFDTGKYSLFDVKRMMITDYREEERLLRFLKNRKRQYGTENPEALKLTDRIMRHVTKETEGFRTEYGGRLKFGLSAPTYIDAAKDSFASFDGRHAGEPFAVHISNETSESYTEIINFAADLDYMDNRFNGNVIDFMVNPDFLRNHLAQFAAMLQVGIEKGIFQLQMNVVSSHTLIQAKKNPEDFPHLIVRVWGFSAFFNELPDDYKNMLIERALRNEGKGTAMV